jgi:serpin B
LLKRIKNAANLGHFPLKKGFIMKHAGTLLSCLVLLVFTNCSKNPASTVQTPGLPFAVAKSASVVRETAPVDPTLLNAQAESNNRFAVALYKKLITGNSNLFFSPYSMTMALAMATAGAAGATDSAIRQALSVTLSGDDFHAALNAIDLSLMGYVKSAPGITLNVVNSAWCQTGWDFRISYLDKLSRYYGAGVNLLDFATNPENSRLVINTWVGDQTNQKILDLLPPGSITDMTRLVLTNAVYFFGSWLDHFDSSLTKNRGFTTDTGTVTAPIMQLGQTGNSVKMIYSQNDDARAIEFPYAGNRLTMTVLLPDYGKFAMYENALSFETIMSLINWLDSTQLPPVLFPRFQFTTGSLSLVPGLEALGMENAFNPASADFSGIDGRRDLYIKDVFHKAYISVNERGTEAAAATGVIMPPVGMEKPKQFYATSPFIFMIRDRQTNVILFMGRIMDPTKSE